MEWSGTVSALARYPVKSLLGEDLQAVEVDGRGLVGDRVHALRTPEGRLGSGKTTRRFQRIDGLLGLRAALDGEVPVISAPDGVRWRGDDPGVDAALSQVLGQPVSLVAEGEVPHHDDGPVHVLTAATLAHVRDLVPDAAIPARRFRPNVVLDGPGPGLVEHGWVGAVIALGDQVRLRVVDLMPRCVMVSAAQADLPADPRVLRSLPGPDGPILGVLAEVQRPGQVRVGDAALVL